MSRIDRSKRPQQATAVRPPPPKPPKPKTKSLGDTFKGVSAGAGAGLRAAAGLSASATTARAGLAKAAGSFAAASGSLSAERPKAAAVAGGIAADLGRISADPSKAFGPLSLDVGAITERAKGLLGGLQEGLGSLTDLAKKGVEQIRSGVDSLVNIGSGLDAAKERAIDEIREQTVDPSIDRLNSTGDSVKVNLGGELECITPVPVLKAKGTVDTSAEVKREEDGSYTVSTEANLLLGASVGAEDPAAGNSASADLLTGGGGKVEFKVKPVMMPDGKTVDEAKTKAKVKELLEGLGRQAMVAASPPGTQPLTNAAIGPTKDQLELIRNSVSALELKGANALNLAAKLNLPGVATLDLAGKVTSETVLRLEKTDKGYAVSLKNTLGGEIDVQGSGNMGTINGGVNGKGKVELEQRFEFEGVNSVSELLTKGPSQKPTRKATLTMTVDGQVGVGTGLSGETGVIGGGVKQQGRLGTTTEVKVDVTDAMQNVPEMAKKTMEGKLSEAAKLAGDGTKIEVKSTIYVERSTSAEAAGGNKTVAKGKVKAEVLERDVVYAPPPTTTTATQVASTIQQALEEANRRAQPQRPRSPVLMRG